MRSTARTAVLLLLLSSRAIDNPSLQSEGASVDDCLMVRISACFLSLSRYRLDDTEDLATELALAQKIQLAGSRVREKHGAALADVLAKRRRAVFRFGLYGTGHDGAVCVSVCLSVCLCLCLCLCLRVEEANDQKQLFMNGFIFPQELGMCG